MKKYIFKPVISDNFKSVLTVIAENYGLELYNNSLFLFCGGRNDRFKGLFWDGEGFIMLYKRFENGHLSWPRNSNEAKELSAQQLDWLLQGLNPLPIRKIQAVRPGSFYRVTSI